jgi:hypothetical protein
MPKHSLLLVSDHLKMPISFGRLHEEMYPMMVIFEESCRSETRKVRKRGVKGLFQSQVCIGLKTSSSHPYAYLAIEISNLSQRRNTTLA